MTDLSSTPAGAGRIRSIDALRGLVILLMLVDHARESFFLHAQVSDPMDLGATSPALFFTRLTAHLCAPVFVLLTGLGAALHAERNGRAATSAFLMKRGLFLVVLELTLVGLAWNFDPTPPIRYLQVIWVIGVSMIALAALLHLPARALVAVGLILVLGHNLLDGVAGPDGGIGRFLWSVLHRREMHDLPWGGQLRVSYPLLPWIGVIALGYAMGPWFGRGMPGAIRRKRLAATALAALALFALLRLTNVYGDPTPWQAGESGLATLMSVLNLTKYPPSADFLLLTLGIGLLLLAWLERAPARVVGLLAVFGGAPLFFYLLHLYLLNGLNLAASFALGRGGERLSVPDVPSIWLLAIVVAVPCWFACRAFGRIKRASGRAWMRYL